MVSLIVLGIIAGILAVVAMAHMLKKLGLSCMDRCKKGVVNGFKALWSNVTIISKLKVHVP